MAIYIALLRGINVSGHNKIKMSLFHQSILDSKLAKNLQKLGGLVTSRNWNTIIKLATLAKAM